MDWTTSCVDWEDRIVAKKSIVPCKPLFPSEAEAALAVFKSLKIVDAPGSPTFGEACGQWVFDFVAAIFGAYDPSTGRRLIREFFLLISKKNSKSTIAAGIMVTALIRNWRNSAELLILAPTKEVADNAFKPAADMVRADPVLSKQLHVQDHRKTITHKGTKATLKVVAADNDTVSGKKAAFVLVDELWLFGKKETADAMLREATGGLISKPEGFTIFLSTQSDAPPAGVFKAKLDYYRNIRDGEIEDKKSLGVIYEFPRKMVENEAYLDPANAYITNPNIGRSVSQEWLEDELRKEMAGDGDTRRTFLSKHLNVEIGLNLRSDRWPGADYWEGGASDLTLDTLLERSEVVTVGIDGGGLDDLFGLSVIGRDKKTRDWLCWTKAWAHDDVLIRRKDIASVLQDFERDKDLAICEDALQPIRDAASIVERVQASGLLPEENGVGLDPFGIGALIDELSARGIEGNVLTAIRQGSALSPASWGIEIKLKNKTFWHSGSRLMNWCVGNAKTEVRGGAVLITKQTAGRAKIDPLVAVFNAAILMSRNPESRQHGIDEFVSNMITVTW
ncbi:terminase large subunit [Ferirhizobium litorale]|uniref:Terminase large subunit n=1 Tax=Ferirhizobium litorale TaxID=2927786 RepID=A0AAE3QGC1_9HYPH|nr:terminase large subunit [Fererhizobium litorale]MDI7923393.1 terminase large subunit [Fererhizobium litorale]